MNSKQTSPISSQTIQIQLSELYARREVVTKLIESIEEYAQLGPVVRAPKRKAA